MRTVRQSVILASALVASLPLDGCGQPVGTADELSGAAAATRSALIESADDRVESADDMDGSHAGYGHHMATPLPGGNPNATVGKEPCDVVNRAPIYSFIDMGNFNFYVGKPGTSQLVGVKLTDVVGYPGSVPLHTLLNQDGSYAYVSYMASDVTQGGIVVLQICAIDWESGKVDVHLEKNLVLDEVGEKSRFPAVTQTVPAQVIEKFFTPELSQIHAPTVLPGSKYAYFTIWTDSRVVVIDLETNEVACVVDLGDATSQLHGIYFNRSGTVGLGAGYWFDKKEIRVFRPDRGTGELTHEGDILLGRPDEYGAFVHKITWIDDRYAVLGTMQFGETSLTNPPASHEQDQQSDESPHHARVLTPGIWLVDAEARTAKQIVETAADRNDAGIWLSASTAYFMNDRLFVGEEDTLDGSFGGDGSLAVFDLSDRASPVFLKRFSPGNGLPADFAVAHSLSAIDDDHLLLESFVSGYISMIDTRKVDLTILRSKSDGLVSPHGIFASGKTN